jgi:hypothetical protein
MSNRLIAALLPLLLFLSFIIWFIETFGKAILITGILIFIGFIIWLLFGNSREVFSTESEKQDLQWDLYIAIQGNNTMEAKKLIENGANPFTPFSKEKSPACTNAKNCYEFVKESGNRVHFLTLFEDVKNVYSKPLK